ncbi:MAG: hypothetical protein KIT57_08545 [Blastocatellales bacterium]|nr:hypothetical protein [Blastocatellales bacterium]
MKARFCLVMVSFLILNCSVVYGQTPKKAAEWEYKQLANPSDEVLNHHAGEGWEIITAAGGGGDGGFYKVLLKRHKSQALFGKPTTEFPNQEPPPQNTACKLTLAQAPSIRGIRLGMTSEELFNIFPATSENERFNRDQRLKEATIAPNYGWTTFRFNPSAYSTKDTFSGMGEFSTELFDGKVVSILVNYPQAPHFESTTQLMDLLTKRFNLPEPRYWSGYNDKVSMRPLIACDGFTVQMTGHFQRGPSDSFSVALVESTYKKAREDRKRADDAKKREAFVP